MDSENYFKKIKKIAIFNPFRTNVEFLKILINKKINFEVYLTRKLHDSENYMYKYIQNNLYYFDSTTHFFSKNDLLIPCDDESFNIVDQINVQTQNIFSDLKTHIKFRCNKIEYLKLINNDILDEIEIPCVVKPKKSAGGENTYFILNDNDKKKYKNLSSDMIIQKYWSGIEFSVDTISVNGQHSLIGIWQYYKVNGSSALRSKIEFVDSKNTIINPLFNFISICLDKVGKKFGAVHSEVIFDGNQFHLIEFNFRFHGHLIHDHCMKCTNFSHFSAFINSLILEQPIDQIYNFKTYGAKILINLPKKISLSNIDYSTIEQLKSVIRIIKHPSTNINKNEYGPTIDVKSCLCYIMVYNNGLSYEQDLKIIDSWYNNLIS